MNCLWATFHWAIDDLVILLLAQIDGCIDDVHVVQPCGECAQVISGALLQILEDDRNVLIVNDRKQSMKIVNIQIFNRGANDQCIDQAGLALRGQ